MLLQNDAEALGAISTQPLRRFRTKDTPVASIRFGLSNLIFGAGAMESA